MGRDGTSQWRRDSYLSVADHKDLIVVVLLQAVQAFHLFVAIFV